VKSDLTAPPVVILPTNLRVAGRLLEMLEVAALELGRELGIELGVELGVELGSELELREVLTDETVPPQTVPFTTGRSADPPDLVP